MNEFKQQEDSSSLKRKRQYDRKKKNWFVILGKRERP